PVRPADRPPRRALHRGRGRAAVVVLHRRAADRARAPRRDRAGAAALIRQYRLGQMRRALRALSSVLIVTGVLLVLDAAVTILWQEPVTAVYGPVRQNELGGGLDRLERTPLPAPGRRGPAQRHHESGR